MGPPPTPGLGGLALDVVPQRVLRVILVVGFPGEVPPPKVRLGEILAQLHLLRVLRGHHLLATREESLELAELVSGQPAGIGEPYLEREGRGAQVTRGAGDSRNNIPHCGAIPRKIPPPKSFHTLPYLELNDQLPPLGRVPVDGHPFVGYALHIPRLDNGPCGAQPRTVGEGPNHSFCLNSSPPPKQGEVTSPRLTS